MARSARPRTVSALPLKLRRGIAYAANVYAGSSMSSPAAKVISNWMRQHSDALGFDLNEAGDDGLAFRRGARVSASTWRALGVKLCASADPSPLAPTLLDPRVLRLAEEMAFTPAAASVLQVILDYTMAKPVEALFDALAQTVGEVCALRLDPVLLSAFTGFPEHIIRDAADRQIAPSGLVRTSDCHGLEVLNRLVRAMQDPPTIGDLRSHLLGAEQKAILPLDAFAHLGEDVNRVANILRNGVASGEKGLLIILYGPPGTGKTELAKTLAATVGVPLYAIAETDDMGGEPTRQERLTELRLVQKLLVGHAPACLLLDEAEDLFGSEIPLFGRMRAGSRRFLHQTLEEGTRPVIMTANSLSAFGAPVLRRATCCLEVKIPPPAVRTAMWQQAAEAEGVTMPATDLARLGQRLPTSPALARSAMRAGRLAGGHAEDVTWAIGGIMTAMGHTQALQSLDAENRYDPDLLSTDVDLAALAERLTGPGLPRGFSMLLSGVSGGGKTEFCRYLAERLGMEVLQRRASDILGAYVGETEKAVAAAFKEAADKGALLLFDEVDALIRDRRSAHRTFEISQVNEFLSWLEPGRLTSPVCATTNLADELDAAATRRFMFKVKFSWLTEAQVIIAFRRTFGCEPPASVRTLSKLCPADFALVRRNAAYLGTLGDAQALAAALAREQAAKGLSEGRQIGFCV